MNQKDQSFIIGRKTAITFSATFALMMAGALWTGAVTFQDMQNRIDQNAASVVENKARIVKVEGESVKAQVQFGEIQIQLKSIDANILEIKQQLLKQGV